jgi:isocitrate dehydrogenase
VGKDGNTTVLKASTPLKSGEIIDSSVMKSVKSFVKQLKRLKENVLLSVHLKNHDENL